MQPVLMPLKVRGGGQDYYVSMGHGHVLEEKCGWGLGRHWGGGSRGPGTADSSRWGTAMYRYFIPPWISLLANKPSAGVFLILHPSSHTSPLHPHLPPLSTPPGCHHQVLLDILYGKYIGEQEGQALGGEGRGGNEGRDRTQGGDGAGGPESSDEGAGTAGRDGPSSEPLGAAGTKNEQGGKL